MPPMEYYKVLNLDQDATEQELRIAFRKFALAYHPDKNRGNDEAERKFKFASNAHDVLMDPEKRRIYDEYGEEGLKFGWTPPRRQNPSYYGSSSSSSTSSFGQSYGNNPSQSSASSSRQSKSTNPWSSSSSSWSSSSCHSYGNNASASTSSLHTSYGNVFSFRRSYANNPSFYKSNTQYEYGRTSTGVPFGEPVKKADEYRRTSSGVRFGEPVKKKDAPVYRKLPCSLEQLYTGAVRRMKITRTVIVKGTSKTKEEIEIVTIEIKHGWKVGTKITFSEMGNEKPSMIPADIVFVIAEKPHTLYTRNGDDLLIEQKITHVEALKGTILKIPTLDGRSLSITLPSRVTIGYEHKVPGEGMPLSKVPGRKGTLKIIISNIKYP